MALFSQKLDPHSGAANTEQRGFKRAFALFHDAARRVPAYKDFLHQHDVRADKILTREDFLHVPLTNKQNYFSKYSLKELSWDGTLHNAKYVSTSSGSTGTPFFWPRGADQDVSSGMIFDNIYNHIFKARRRSTLVVNSFALGTWIAGFEFYNAAKFSSDYRSKLTIVTPGIDRGEAVNQIVKLAPSFEQVVILGYPPFVKDIIQQGSSTGIRWAELDAKILVGGEAVSNVWRAKVMEMLGKKDDGFSFVNIYGMAETGVVAHDTPVSTRLRKDIGKFVEEDHSSGKQVMGVYQYYPSQRYFESLHNSSLVLTSNAGLPLLRYDTRDIGGIISRNAIQGENWQLPFLYLYGRKDLSISLYALMIYVENIKHCLERCSNAADLSGLFTMGVSHTENLDQQFDLTVELAADKKATAATAKKMTQEICDSLCRVNTEYSKLLASIGDGARPHITLVPYGQIETVPGRKHKWIKKT